MTANRVRQGNFTLTFPQNRAWDSRLTRLFMFSITWLKIVMVVLISNGQIRWAVPGILPAANGARHTWKDPFPILPISTNDGSAGSIPDAYPHSRTYGSTEWFLQSQDSVLGPEEQSACAASGTPSPWALVSLCLVWPIHTDFTCSIWPPDRASCRLNPGWDTTPNPVSVVFLSQMQT